MTSDENLSGTKIKEILADSECPFTWEIAQSAALYRSIHPWQKQTDANADHGDEMGIKMIMHLLIKCYENVMDVEMDKAKIVLEECEQYYLTICDRKEFRDIKRGIKHVIDGTKCHYLYENDEIEELKKFISTAVQMKNLNDKERGTVYGCEGVVWSMFHDFGLDKALQKSLEAIKLHATFPMWHFIYAVNLRRKRRILDIHSNPSDEEREHFTLAYNNSKDTPTYAIYYAQMRREMTYGLKNRHNRHLIDETEREIVQIYKNIYDCDPSVHVLLKLALGFIRTNLSDESAWAQKCLAKVAKTSEDHPTYLHYMALLHEHTGNYKDAVIYFKKAADYNNFVAEMCYVNYAHNVGNLNNPTEYLLQMVDKYHDYIHERKQVLFLALGTSYYFVDKNMKKASEYYLKAIELDPKSKSFTGFYSYLGFNTKDHGRNMYDFFKKTFLPQTLKEAANQDLMNACASIRKHCDNYHTTQINNSIRGFRHLKL